MPKPPDMPKMVQKLSNLAMKNRENSPDGDLRSSNKRRRALEDTCNGNSRNSQQWRLHTPTSPIQIGRAHV